MRNRDRFHEPHAVLDEASRLRKAAKITKILGQEIDLRHAKVLDIGTGTGHIAEYIAKHAGAVTSIDVLDQRKTKSGYDFRLVEDERLPFPNNSFDVVISNHVVEHVYDQQLHLSEISRVLKPGGIIYLATPNRLWITDPHFKVPFINWMPRAVATAYLKAILGKYWDVRPVTLHYLKKHIPLKHNIKSLAGELIKYPDKYNVDIFKELQPITKRLPRSMLGLADYMSPTLLVIITKA